jgi:hypothetical protein
MKRTAFILALSLWMIPLVIPIRSVAAQRALPPAASGGVLGLGQWQLDRHGPFKLAGQWEFYWGALLSPNDFHGDAKPEKTGWFSMPAVWNGVAVDGRNIGGSGFATFRLHLRMGSRQGRQALMIPYAFTAYRLWIDDRLAVTVGRVGSSAGRMVPSYRPTIVFIDEPFDGEVVLTLQISNFMHAKGGMRDPIRLVAASQVSGLKHRVLVKDVLVFGCLLIMSIYHSGPVGGPGSGTHRRTGRGQPAASAGTRRSRGRRGGAVKLTGAPAAGAEDGSDRHPGRWRGPRSQQHSLGGGRLP